MNIIRQNNPNAACKFRYGYYNDSAVFVAHREDGPAIEWSDDVKSWMRHGLVHRIDGPAIELPRGNDAKQGFAGMSDEWWYNGECADVYSQEDFEKWLKYRNF
jgi:hypothetical protein